MGPEFAITSVQYFIKPTPLQAELRLPIPSRPRVLTSSEHAGHTITVMKRTTFISTIVCLALSLSAIAAPQQGPPPAVRAAIDALVQMLQASDEASAKAFAEARLSDAYRQTLGDGVIAHLTRLREATRGAFGEIGVERDQDGSMSLMLSGDREAVIQMRLNETSGKFDRLDTPGGSGAPGGGAVGGGESAGDAERSATVGRRIRAIEALRDTPAAFAEFRAEHLAPALGSPDTLGDDVLRTIARAAMASGMVNVGLQGNEYLVRLDGGASADIFARIGPEAPFLIEALRVATGDAAGPRREPPPVEPLSWDALEGAIDEAVAWGFSGTVLAVRDGRVVLHQSYGAADRATGRPNTNDTIYGIGSIPIDFTRASIYLLVQRTALTLDDPISRFYPDAPDDKATVTIRQLLTSASGLPNFHHVATDEDHDLTWIDRATAEARILAQPLLFDPGTGSSNSHSAFGLLAAIVERVSGQTYGAFLRTNFFEPAGMTRTGFYGDLDGHAVTDFAVGHDGNRAGQPNIPPNWGHTSWLVMGSGGMYSTPADMHRWFSTLRSGKVLTGDALAGYLRRGHAIGASDRGFLFVHAWAGGDSMVFLAQNSHLDRPETSALWRRLATLAVR